MELNEDLIWEKINTSKNKAISSDWLYKSYSLNISFELRQNITEKLGLMSKDGWGKIKLLIREFGNQPELIKAAGLSHQFEAKTWLLALLKENKKLELHILKALTCWGASLACELLKEIFSDLNIQKRLTGIGLLEFKAHQLTEEKLLDITEGLLEDIRDPVIINTIKILQRHDGFRITNKIAKLARTGSEKVAHTAIIALGSIGTVNSFNSLKSLHETLPESKRLDLVRKQLNHQYRRIDHDQKSTGK